MDTAVPSKDHLYKILDFHRVVQIFEKRELYFAHPTMWDDPYEHHDYKTSGSVFAQCWCRLGVSDAMWRIYSPNGLGVRVSTTQRKLAEVLETFKAAREDCSVRYGPVAYRTQTKIKEALSNLQKFDEKTDRFALDPLFLKRNAFSHETEWRAAIYCSDGPKEKEDGLRVPVDPRDLFDNILLDPRAPGELVAAFEFYFKEKLGFPKHVGRSKLYEQPRRPLKES